MSGLGADTQEYLRIGRKLEILPDKIHGILMFLAFHFSTLVIKTLKMSLHKERNAYHHLINRKLKLEENKYLKGKFNQNYLMTICRAKLSFL